MLQNPSRLSMDSERSVDLIVLWPHLSCTALHAYAYGWIAHYCWPLHVHIWSWPTNIDNLPLAYVLYPPDCNPQKALQAAACNLSLQIETQMQTCSAQPEWSSVQSTLLCM